MWLWLKWSAHRERRKNRYDFFPFYFCSCFTSHDEQVYFSASMLYVLSFVLIHIFLFSSCLQFHPIPLFISSTGCFLSFWRGPVFICKSCRAGAEGLQPAEKHRFKIHIKKNTLSLLENAYILHLQIVFLTFYYFTSCLMSHLHFQHQNVICQ